jgi:hypothetical protein
LPYGIGTATDSTMTTCPAACFSVFMSNSSQCAAFDTSDHTERRHANPLSDGVGREKR